MPIRFQCSSCGKKLRVADEAAGKKIKCPDCGTGLRIPESSDDVIYDAEPALDVAQKVDPGRGGSGISGDSKPRRPCPACGEMIVTSAAKCRFCGEIFDPALKKKKKKKSKSSRSSYVDDDEMTAGDWVVAILCSGIGCIAGIVWMIQGKSKGGKMIGVSLTAGVCWNILFRVIIPLLLGEPVGGR